MPSSECVRWLRWFAGRIGWWFESAFNGVVTGGPPVLRRCAREFLVNLDPTKLSTRWRRGLALVLGIAFSFAFPRSSVAGLAWVIPGLLLILTRTEPGKGAFQMGSIFGLGFALPSLYWMNFMPVTGFPVLGWVALSSYHAVYYGGWAWFAGWLLKRFDGDPCALTWIGRTIWAIQLSALWVAIEFTIGRFLTGFPWLQVGVTQFELVPLIQLASITGVGGLSFLVVWFSISFALALEGMARNPSSRAMAWREIFLPLSMVALIFAWGTGRVREIDQAMERSAIPVRVATIQPSVPQTMIWDPAAETNRFNRLLELSREALKDKPQLLLWPEAAMPGYLRHERHISEQVIELVREHEVWLVCNGNDARYAEGVGPPGRPDHFNTAFLVSPAGELVAQYDKQHLVIFGEYVPLSEWLPFLKWFTPIEVGFKPGTEAVQFPVLNASVLICFEDAFAHLARRAVTEKTRYLINLTNDGWFGRGPEQWQHAINSIFRSVETGRPLLRSANDGISCWIDPAGRVRDAFSDAGGSKIGLPRTGSVYAEGIQQFDVRLPLHNITTFYWKHGNWFVWGCFAVVGLSVMRGRLALAGGVQPARVEPS